MKLSQLIRVAEDAKKKHGDVEVDVFVTDGDEVCACKIEGADADWFERDGAQVFVINTIYR